MSKAANRKNTADILKEQKEDRKRFFAARRQQASNTGSPVVGNVATGLNFSLGDFDITTGNTSGLSPNGGVMSGPIAFNSKVVSITSDKLTIASILELPTSYVIVNGEGGNADDLKTIITQNVVVSDNGAWFRGQLLFLQAGNANITLKHNASGGNIFIPSGSDLTLNKYDSSANTGGAYAILMWDDQNTGASSGRWVLVSSGSGSSSSGANTTLSNLAATTALNSSLVMTGNSVTDLQQISFRTATATPIQGSLYFDGTDVQVKTGGGTKNLSNIGSSAGANQTLSNLTDPTTINANLEPDNTAGTANERDLGHDDKIWAKAYIKDIYNTGLIKTESDDHELQFYTGGGQRLAISDNSSNGAGYAELFGVIAGSGETQTHPSYKTVSTDAAPADNDMVGAFGFDGYNSTTTRKTWARIVGVSDNVANNSETAHIEFKALQSGTEKTLFETDQWGIYLINDVSSGSTSPGYNGAIFRDGNDVKIYSGGAVRNITTMGGSGFPSPVTGTLDMNDNMITNITLAGIVDTGGTSRGSISGDSAGVVVASALTKMVDVTTNIAAFAKQASGGIEFYADLDMNSKKIQNVTDPTSAQDAATKSYVDSNSGAGANEQLSNLSGTVAVNKSLLPGSSSAYDLGSSSKKWRYIYAIQIVTPNAITMGGDIDMNGNDIDDVGLITTDGLVGTGAFAWSGSSSFQTTCNITALYSGTIYIGQSDDDVGFFGASAVGKQTIPSNATLAQVVTALRNLGLGS